MFTRGERLGNTRMVLSRQSTPYRRAQTSDYPSTTPQKRMSGRGGEKSEQGQGCFCLREASAAGNRLAVLPRRSTMRKRKQALPLIHLLPHKKECRGGAGKFRVKGKNVFVCTRRAPQAILLRYCQGGQRRTSGNRLHLSEIFPHRPDKKDKGDIYVVPRGTRICLSR